MNPLKIGFLVAASIAGAGFASGKEIMVFFTKYENVGVAGLAFCAIVLFIYGYIGMKLSHDINASSIKVFLDYYFGKYSFLFQFIITAFIFVVFSVMLCGAGELIFAYTGLNYYISSMIFLTIVIWTTGKGQDFIQKISIFLMGILFISIIIFSIFINLTNYGNNCVAVFGNFGRQFNYLFSLWESLTYCGYNALLATSTLVGISKGIKKTKQILYGSIIGALILILPAFLMNSTMLPFVETLEMEEFPFVYLLELINKNLGILYAFIVFIAMTLSAMINGYFLRKINIFIPIAGYSLVFTGFSAIIGKIYPVFGIGGIIFLSILIIRYFMIYFEGKSVF